MDLAELFEKRRTIRDYEDKEVPMDLLMVIINESIKAPSGGNRQPWRFIIINNRDWIKRCSDASKRGILNAIERNPGHYMQRYETALKNEKFNVFYNAPCLVYICGPKQEATLVEDCSLFACYFMLSATARDLGTCWVALGGGVRDPEILNEIGLPEGHVIVAPIIIGYPKRIPKLPERKKPQVLKVIS
ncbi:MAG: nitroreductase family protein [Deltaproteobacteria bacterium]|nr:nitroreductase family protein [Deltaproteobacteria bacterium]MBW2142283.1 nitroreductase family protein [Deltaproteobacteria bacterium]MBW2324660.1 nitroreductase family protein [Deltaproteobacteria bacterium]